VPLGNEEKGSEETGSVFMGRWKLSTASGQLGKIGTGNLELSSGGMTSISPEGYGRVDPHR
jgi:hypothetical protein